MYTFDEWRDKARNTLARVSHFLGEGNGVALPVLHHQRRAQESLDIELPTITSLLPYETMDEDALFINRHSAGFGFELAPLAGADESLVKTLAELFKNKLPDGVDCMVVMFKHPHLGGQLSRSFQSILERGGIYAALARRSLDFHLKAIKSGYKNGRNVPAQLADYRCYLFISMPKKSNCQNVLRLLRDDWESEFKVAGFSQRRLDKETFQSLLRAVVSPDFDNYYWPDVQTTPGELINQSIPHPSTAYEIHDTSIDVSLSDEQGGIKSTRLVNCHITRWPSEKEPFALWQTPDLFANLLRSEQGIQCPFLISFSIRGVNQERVKALAQRRASSLSSNANAVQTFLTPSIVHEARQWNYVHAEAAKGDLTLFPTVYNLLLFTSKDKEREHVAKAMSAYRQFGFTLTQARHTQWLRFLSSLPFVLTEGLFSRFEMMGMTKKLSNDNLANLLPVVSDFKGSPEGLLLPTYRHQAFFLNTFDDTTLPITNFNRLTVASTGAGKSFFEQAQILDGLSRGEQIFVIDLGASYKHLCEVVGGTYIDASTLVLNPFTLFDFEGVADCQGEQAKNYVQIRDLLAIMASPNKELEEVQKAWLLEATLICWRQRGNRARIDDVLDALRELLTRPESLNDMRLKHLIILLSKYGSDGLYGPKFNSETSLFNGSNFVVLEMGELEEDPELLSVVMFVMIVIIQGQFYHSDRRKPKRCIIDEAWRFLTVGSNPTSATFISQGFRTARKYMGSFAVITQKQSDTTESLQGQAIAASADTKIVMRQGAFDAFVESHPTVFNSMQQKMIKSFGVAKLQGYSDLMIQFGTQYSFHRFYCDPFLRILFSTSGDVFGEIEALTAQGVPLMDAVTQIAHRLYGDEL